MPVAVAVVHVMFAVVTRFAVVYRAAFVGMRRGLPEGRGGGFCSLGHGGLPPPPVTLLGQLVYFERRVPVGRPQSEERRRLGLKRGELRQKGRLGLGGRVAARTLAPEYGLPFAAIDVEEGLDA